MTLQGFHRKLRDNNDSIKLAYQAIFFERNLRRKVASMIMQGCSYLDCKLMVKLWGDRLILFMDAEEKGIISKEVCFKAQAGYSRINKNFKKIFEELVNYVEMKNKERRENGKKVA